MNSTATGKMRLAIVLSHPIQYYSPWFRWINSHSSIELRVFYLWDFGVAKHFDPEFGTSIKWDIDLLSGYDSEFVPNVSRFPGADNFFGFNNPSITRVLGDWRPDALLLFGYKWATHMRLIAWARFRRIPIIFRGDSHLLGRVSIGGHVRLALRALFSRISAFLYVGAANREYFETFGVPAQKLFFSPHSVDASLYSIENLENRRAAESFRVEQGIRQSTKVVLFAGKLVPAKQPKELLEAFLALDADDTVLIFVGDGSEKDKLVRVVAEGKRSALRSRVIFLPFANQSEMPARYLAADLFVLPSRGVYETWGLAVNEAMHMGLPCLVSNLVGCQRDLVTHDETGWVFDPTDALALKQALFRALEELRSSARAQQIRQAVMHRIAGYNYAQTTEGLLSAIAAVTKQN